MSYKKTIELGCTENSDAKSDNLTSSTKVSLVLTSDQ